MEREERLFQRATGVLSALVIDLRLGFREQLGDEEVFRTK